jgi:hypothetical protein
MSEHTAGSLVWYRDAKTAWVKAEVTSVHNRSITVVTEKGEQLSGLKAEQVLLQNLDHEDVPVSNPHPLRVRCKP